MTRQESTLHARIDAIRESYGHSPGYPTREAWHQLAACPEDTPVTLVNFFKLHAQAVYPDGTKTTGQTAFDRYAAVSMPSLAKVGGHFLLVAPFGNSFVGPKEQWDLVAIGTYPNPDALLRLFELETYRACYAHRVAACADQRVSLCLG
ncbi:MAG: DUF1330 domain-containing protein [Pseudomonadota bacterium]